MIRKGGLKEEKGGVLLGENEVVELLLWVMGWGFV